MPGSPHASVAFRIRTDAIPASWADLRKRLGARRSSRSTRWSPIWHRLDGPGYTLWLSEFRIQDGASKPVTWELRLEALAPLPPAGTRFWAEACEALEGYFDEAGIPYQVR